MQAYARKNNNNQRTRAAPPSQKKTPFCDVCYKKGLPIEKYQSHYPRSKPGPDGVIVCPTILSAQCNYCGLMGHWENERYCQALREDNFERDRREAAEKKNRRQQDIYEMKKARTDAIWNPAPLKAGGSNKPTGGFAALLEDDEPQVVEKKVKEVKKKETKEIAKEVAKEVAKETTSWASIATKPARLVPLVQPTLVGWTQLGLGQKFVYTPSVNIEKQELAYQILDERRAAGHFDEEW